MSLDLDHLCAIAQEAAVSAGRVIQQYMNQKIQVEQKKGGESLASQVVTKADLASEEVILSFLKPTSEDFDISLLTEEAEDDKSRLEKDYFWCVDPLDGTLPFINNQKGFSVAIALVRKDGIPLVGVVFDPSTNTLYHASKGSGAFKNGLPWKNSCDNDYLTYVTDRKLKDTEAREEIQQVLTDLERKLGLKRTQEINGGGSVMNAIQVLENGPACMMKLPKKSKGGGSLWDYAATACIFHELGLPATNWKGDKLDLNKVEDTFMNHEGIRFINTEILSE